MSRKIQEILEWYSKFNKSDVIVKSKNHEFEFSIEDKQLPHLLGLHYAPNQYLKGSKLYNFVRSRTDEQLYGLIKENNPSKLQMVAARVENFKFFMENLENSFVYEQTHPETKLKSEFLLVDLQDGSYLQLGIGNNGVEDYLETFIVRHDDSYFKDSQIKEQVEGLYRLDDAMIPVPFSFNLERNRQLEEIRRRQAEQEWYRDSDLDGLSDSLEYAIGTNPFSVDTDGDGISDLSEHYGKGQPTTPERHLTSEIEAARSEAGKPDNFIHQDIKTQEKEL